ncbi:MAG: MFS transporter [Oscillospiraceae bacterium]|nr:MFS transporter [Oscillospiraceae bacterium]
MKQTLWTKNYTLLIIATLFGSIGGIAGGFALSFLVFDETGSTLASALILAIQIIPGFVVPLIAAPIMDRLPRKPFLVFGDAINGVLYTLGGLYLLKYPFTYIGYLAFSLVLNTLGSFDSLAYNSIYPKLIPEGYEQKGYTVSAMLYPVLQVIMMPLAAVLLDAVGVGWILIIQGSLSVLAAVTESFIHIKEEKRLSEKFSFKMWLSDIRQALIYLKNERGIRSIYSYMAVTNGAAQGYSPLMVAFFRTAPGFTAAMYSLFSVAEFAGRTIGGLVHYKVEIPPKKRFSFAFLVYQIYETMDMCLLWLPYPFMLANRIICGFLGINSAALRQTAVQKYIPEELRARLNAFQDIMILGSSAVLTLIIGALGEIMDLRLCVTLCAFLTLISCWLTVWKNRKDVHRVYEKDADDLT